MKKIAIFGGTFNPVHNGHLNLCNELQKLFHFDEIILIPTNIPPHKATTDLASNEDRLNMLRLATNQDNFLHVSDIEYKLNGTSYTYHTIQALKEQDTDCELYLIIGSDMFKIFDQWFRFKDILQEVTVVVGARHEKEFEDLLALKKMSYQNTKKIQIANIGIYEVASTDIRNAVKQNKSLNGWLPQAVQDYILTHELYL